MGLSEQEKRQFIEGGHVVVKSALDPNHPTILEANSYPFTYSSAGHLRHHFHKIWK
jgi:hypothetical protein